MDLLKIYRPSLLFILLFLLVQQLFSATFIEVPKTDSFLVATKGTKQFKYKLRTHLSIRYNNASGKISGQLYQVSNDSVFLIQNSKSNSIIKVAIKDISSVTILHKKGRKHWVIYLSIYLILAIVGLTFSTQGSLIALPILVLPVLSLFTYIPFLFFNFLSDVFSKKSTSRGWSFEKRGIK